MPAYVIANVEVTDPELFAEYRELVLPTVNAYGGKYIARGGRAELLEGDRDPNRTVIIEFPSLEQAKAWHGSEEYATPQGYAYPLHQQPRHSRRGPLRDPTPEERLRTVSALPGAVSRVDDTRKRTDERLEWGISPNCASMTTGASSSSALGINVSNSRGFSVLIPTAPNDSAKRTKSGL